MMNRHCGCWASQAGLALALGSAVLITGIDNMVNHKDMEVWMPSEV